MTTVLFNIIKRLIKICRNLCYLYFVLRVRTNIKYSFWKIIKSKRNVYYKWITISLLIKEKSADIISTVLSKEG